MLAALLLRGQFHRVMSDTEKSKHRALISLECWLFVLMVSLTMLFGVVFIPEIVASPRLR